MKYRKLQFFLMITITLHMQAALNLEQIRTKIADNIAKLDQFKVEYPDILNDEHTIVLEIITEKTLQEFHNKIQKFFGQYLLYDQSMRFLNTHMRQTPPANAIVSVLEQESLWSQVDLNDLLQKRIHQFFAHMLDIHDTNVSIQQSKHGKFLGFIVAIKYLSCPRNIKIKEHGKSVVVGGLLGGVIAGVIEGSALLQTAATLTTSSLAAPVALGACAGAGVYLIDNHASLLLIFRHMREDTMNRAYNLLSSKSSILNRPFQYVVNFTLSPNQRRELRLQLARDLYGIIQSAGL